MVTNNGEKKGKPKPKPKTNRIVQDVDNLNINASWDDIINLSVGKGVTPKKQAKQNVTPTKKKK